MSENLPPTTTRQEDDVTEGQRHINKVWEYTQASVALMVSATTLYVSARLALSGETTIAAFIFLSNAFSLVIGFYFSRTNHTAIGGMGSKPNPPYEGR